MASSAESRSSRRVHATASDSASPRCAFQGMQFATTQTGPSARSCSRWSPSGMRILASRLGESRVDIRVVFGARRTQPICLGHRPTMPIRLPMRKSSDRGSARRREAEWRVPEAYTRPIFVSISER